MQATETTVHYGIVRRGGGGHNALYDVVRHTPGQADEILARGAAFDHATAIVKALNSEMGA
jgi:hypothetical protein